MSMDEGKSALTLIPGDREWTRRLTRCGSAGSARAQFLLYRLLKRARTLNVGLSPTVQTPYINTLTPDEEPPFPGDESIELKIRRIIRWNAAVMVHRANK